MPTMLQAMLGEVQQEAATTRRVLERVPEEKLTWRPHEKSLTIGQLAQHIASIPGGITKLAQPDEFQIPADAFNFPQPKNLGEVFATHDESVRAAESYLAGLSEKAAFATWRLKAGDREIMAMPRASMLRMIMMNHLYHHRGQMSVYLRLLNVPVPSIYGPSGDENPFA